MFLSRHASFALCDKLKKIKCSEDGTKGSNNKIRLDPSSNATQLRGYIRNTFFLWFKNGHKLDYFWQAFPALCNATLEHIETGRNAMVNLPKVNLPKSELIHKMTKRLSLVFFGSWFFVSSISPCIEQNLKLMGTVRIVHWYISAPCILNFCRHCLELDYHCIVWQNFFPFSAVSIG